MSHRAETSQAIDENAVSQYLLMVLVLKNPEETKIHR